MAEPHLMYQTDCFRLELVIVAQIAFKSKVSKHHSIG